MEVATEQRLKQIWTREYNIREYGSALKQKMISPSDKIFYEKVLRYERMEGLGR